MKHIANLNLETWVKKQIQLWEQAKKDIIKTDEVKPFITISREYGCLVNPVVLALAEELNKYENSDQWNGYDKDLLQKIHDDYAVNEKLLETLDTKKREEMTELMRGMLTDYPPQVHAHIQLIKTVRTLAIQGRKIIVGRAGVVITKDMKYGLHIRMVAPLATRIQSVMERHGIRDRLEAEKLVKEKDKARHDFMTQYVKFDAQNPASYDLTINMAKFSTQEMIDLIINALKSKKFLK